MTHGMRKSIQTFELVLADQRHKRSSLMVLIIHLVVWVLKAEVAVLTEKETVVFRGSGGLSCHGRAEWRVGTLREVGRLLRRIPTAASDRLNDQRSRGRGEKRLQPHPTIRTSSDCNRKRWRARVE